MQALLDIHDGRQRQKLFESDGLTLENAIQKCKIAESSHTDMKVIKDVKVEKETSCYTKKTNKQGKTFKETQVRSQRNIPVLLWIMWLHIPSNKVPCAWQAMQQM